MITLETSTQIRKQNLMLFSPRLRDHHRRCHHRDNLKVLSSNSFIDGIGYYHVVGEIENGTPESVSYVQATGTFYDKNNNVVGTSYSYTSPSDLGPGEKAPFEIILTSASIPVNQIDHYRVTASSQ